MKFLFIPLILISIILCASGCARFRPRSPVAAVDSTVLSASAAMPAHCKIQDADRLRQGGKVVILLFIPGPGIEATPEVENISLMAVKGLTESLERSDTPFTFFSPSEKPDADLVVEGYISRFDKPRGLKKLVLRKRTASLEITGKMRTKPQARSVLHFSYLKKAGAPKDRDYSSWGYEIGKALGDEINAKLHFND